MDEGWLLLAGVIVFILSFGLMVRGLVLEGWDKVKEMRWLLLFLVAMYLLMFWVMGRAILALNGAFGIAWVGYYVGKAIINEAHKDLRPDESDRRRRVYTAVQVAVCIGIIWAVGSIIGVDWRTLLEAGD